MKGDPRDYGVNGGLVAAFSKRERKIFERWNDYVKWRVGSWTPYDPMIHSLRKPEQAWMQLNNSGFVQTFGSPRFGR